MSLFTLSGILPGEFAWSPSVVWNIFTTALLLASTYLLWLRLNPSIPSRPEEGAVNTVDLGAGTSRHKVDNTAEAEVAIIGDLGGEASDALHSHEKSSRECEDVKTLAADTPKRNMDNTDYTVGWICAISTEYVAAQEFLDEEHGQPVSVSTNDTNDYMLGTLGGHNVVIAVLPDGEYGTSSAAMVATNMLHSFPNVRIGLMVGIGGGAPSSEHDIRLGDIVVSAPRDGKGGVFQYDFGKTIQDQAFRCTGFLNQPPISLRTALSGIRAQYERKGHQLEANINAVLEKNSKLRLKYRRPELKTDRLFKTEVTHDSRGCAEFCAYESSNLIQRPNRSKDDDDPAIHYGLIASANQLMKDASIRDKFAEQNDVLCFEMEAAGLMNHFPCLVIRGICDYSDSHKNKQWQGYAAMAAAAYARDLLYRIPPDKVKAEKRISEILSGVQQGVSELVRVQHNQENEAILNWLTPIEYGPQHSDFLKRRVTGTGQWLVDSGEYQTWLDSDKHTLFCPGIPGSGKTMLTTIVVDDLLTRFLNDPTVGIAYIYCQYKQRDEQKIETLLASLLKQLARGRSTIPKSVEDLYKLHQKNKTRPQADEISNVLQSVAASYSKVFIVVDALDECQEDNRCRSELLSYIFALQSKTVTNFFATSRPILDIQEQFKKYSKQEVSARDEDVRKYVDRHILDLPKFIHKRPDVQENIKTVIASAVEGMFLLAQLYFDSLKDKTSEREINSALEQLTKQSKSSLGEDNKRRVLEKAYEQAMERINGQMAGFRLLAINILSWVTCAKRQLTIEELQHALAVEIGDTELHKNNLREIDDMVSVCAGLVTVDKESDIVRLVHFTTQEYFTRTWTFWFSKAQVDIAKTCITYLSFDAFERGPLEIYDLDTRLRLNPLYDYAACNWGHHVRAASIEMEPSVLRLLKSNGKVAASSQALLARNTSQYSQLEPEYMASLTVAAYFGLRDTIIALLDSGHNLDLKDSHERTALWYAVASGHEAVVRLLLQHGADVNAEGPFGSKTALVAAVKWRDEAMVRLLLQHGADFNGENLVAAAEGGNTAIVQLLLQHGADVNAEGPFGSKTALVAAVKRRDEAMVRLLLQHGADFNGATLVMAAEGGNTAIVQQLLDCGADIKGTLYGKTALVAAVGKGGEATVRLLLQHGADVNAEGPFGSKTALVAAVKRRDEAMVRLLLQHGADFNDGALLVAAAQGGNIAIVQLLLDCGADIGGTLDGDTALAVAVAKRDETMVRLLLEHNKDIIKTNVAYGGKALAAAGARGDEAIVLFLLEHGADINASEFFDRSGDTALSAAAGKGNLAMVQFLLDHGANINAQSYSSTALMAAVRYGHEAMVKLLLERGADVDVRSGFCDTILMEAVCKENKAIVQLLLNHGADINFQKENGAKVLMMAADRGYEMIVQLLLDCGADINVENKDGSTPLSIATRRAEMKPNSLFEPDLKFAKRAARYKTIVQLLKSAGAS